MTTLEERLDSVTKKAEEIRLYVDDLAQKHQEAVAKMTADHDAEVIRVSQEFYRLEGERRLLVEITVKAPPKRSKS